MKKIILLRHSEAEENKKNDFTRKLTNHGALLCKRVAEFLIYKNAIPDKILCSDSLRTVETLERITDFLKIEKNIVLKEDTIDYKNVLYRCSVQEMLELLQNQNDFYKEIMVISHNPTISNIARNFVNSTHHTQIINFFEPANICMISFAINSWKRLCFNSGHIEWFCDE